MDPFWGSVLSKDLLVYEGPPIPKKEVGMLGSETTALLFAEIDGRTIAEIKKGANLERNIKLIQLLPGEHTIKIVGTSVGDSQSYLSISGTWLLRFKVEPGHIYNLGYEKTGTDPTHPMRSYVSVFIRDADTKEIVSEVVKKQTGHTERSSMKSKKSICL